MRFESFTYVDYVDEHPMISIQGNTQEVKYKENMIAYKKCYNISTTLLNKNNASHQ